MRDSLNFIDVKILEGLAKYGPRNMSKLARELGVPRGTVLSRINRMSSSFYLRLNAIVCHTNLGMKRAFVFAKATLGEEDLLFRCMKAHNFYVYVNRCYGTFEGCMAIYNIPQDHITKFEHFLLELEKSGVAKDIKVYWSTCSKPVNWTTNWFDSHSETWIFPWDKWIGEIPSKRSELPYTLRDPESFSLMADETDVFLIKELEKDATTSLAAIARKLGTTLQNVHYHYVTHVLRNRLIQAFQVSIYPYEIRNPCMLYFLFHFDDEKKMAKFAQSLLDKPFVIVFSKVLEKTTLIVQLYLPRLEFRNFADALSKLVRTGLLRSYDYVNQDLRPGKWVRLTIPYELFKDGSWIYNHNEHIQSLHDLLKRSTEYEVELISE